MKSKPKRHSYLIHKHEILFGEEGNNEVMVILTDSLNKASYAEYQTLDNRNNILVYADTIDESFLMSVNRFGYKLIHDSDNLTIVHDVDNLFVGVETDYIVKDLLTKFYKYNPDEDPLTVTPSDSSEEWATTVDVSALGVPDVSTSTLSSSIGIPDSFKDPFFSGDIDTGYRGAIDPHRARITDMRTEFSISTAAYKEYAKTSPESPYEMVKKRIVQQLSEEIFRHFDYYVDLDATDRRDVVDTTIFRATLKVIPRS